MLCCRLETRYVAAVSAVATGGGGFVVPKLTSYDVAPAAVQDIASEAPETPAALFDGDGDAGVDGGPTTVVNDHTGPTLEPLPFFATICQ